MTIMQTEGVEKRGGELDGEVKKRIGKLKTESGTSETRGDNKSVQSVQSETPSRKVSIPSRDEVQTVRGDGQGGGVRRVLRRASVSCAFELGRCGGRCHGWSLDRCIFGVIRGRTAWLRRGWCRYSGDQGGRRRRQGGRREDASGSKG